MTFGRLMLYAFFVFIGLVIVSLVLPKALGPSDTSRCEAKTAANKKSETVR